MLHGPLTASNLLVTWRRRHGDGEDNVVVGEIMRLELENLLHLVGGGHGEVQSFPRRAERPPEAGADNISLRESERCL